MRKHSIKNTRINGEVQRELANIIRGEIKDPRIHPMTSVVAVEVAPDLKTCKAWISVLGNEQAQQDTIAGLKSAEGFLPDRPLAEHPEIPAVCRDKVRYRSRHSRRPAEYGRRSQRSLYPVKFQKV